jgi:hypothetical protein
MSPELTSRIADWKKRVSDKKERRSVSVKPHRIQKDQYDILLKIELHVIGAQLTEKVTVKARMKTIGAGSPADIKTFDQIVEVLERDFRFRSGQAEGRMGH